MTATQEAPARTELIYREVDVTPEQAKAWLGLNTSNRKLKAKMVTGYAADMVAGRWQLNAEFVKFAGPEDAPTRLLDGQNRLHAVVRAGITVRLCVAFGLPEPTQTTMDTGVKRSVGDTLTLAGISYSSTVAASARLAMKVRDGIVSWRSVPYTNAAIEEYVAEHPALVEAASIGHRYGKKADVTTTLVAYTYWRFSQIDPDEALDFWHDAAEKVGLAPADPVLAMSQWFASARRQRRLVTDPEALSVIYRAWNYRRAKKPWSFVRVDSATRDGIVAIPEPK